VQKNVYLLVASLVASLSDRSFYLKAWIFLWIKSPLYGSKGDSYIRQMYQSLKPTGSSWSQALFSKDNSTLTIWISDEPEILPSWTKLWKCWHTNKALAFWKATTSVNFYLSYPRLRGHPSLYQRWVSLINLSILCPHLASLRPGSIMLPKYY